MNVREFPELNYREANVDDAAAVANVHVNSWKDSFIGIVPDSFMEKLTVESRTKAFRERFSDPTYKMYVAELPTGEVVGFVDAGDPRQDVGQYDAELYAIYILRNFQGKGIGGHLFRCVTEFLKSTGKRSMYLMALEASPYRPFYEKMGGRVVNKQQVLLDGMPFDALVYGWEDLP